MTDQQKVAAGIGGKEYSVDAFVTQGGASIAARSPVLFESVSAMMDDEADALELRRVVKALPNSPDLAGRWRRYHAVRASLRQEVNGVEPRINLLPALHARLAMERVEMPRQTLSGHLGGRFARMLGQGAIAASVAGAILLGYASWRSSSDTSMPEMLAASQSQVSSTPKADDGLPELNGDYNMATVTRTVSLDDAARNRLERAVRNFSGTSAIINVKSTGIFPNQLEPFRPAAPDNSQQ